MENFTINSGTEHVTSARTREPLDQIREGLGVSLIPRTLINALESDTQSYKSKLTDDPRRMQCTHKHWIYVRCTVNYLQRLQQQFYWCAINSWCVPSMSNDGSFWRALCRFLFDVWGIWRVFNTRERLFVFSWWVKTKRERGGRVFIKSVLFRAGSKNCIFPVERIFLSIQLTSTEKIKKKSQQK